MALALAMVLQATPTPAVAVTGYDSAFLFESDWLIVKQGESGQAAVTFLNVGSVSWQKGGASQVNLATCCPLNSPPTHAAWAVTWLSSTAYATHREDLVAPGGRGTYIWNFKAPDTAAVGIYDFPGDLVLASTGEAIHREGYFHRNDLRTAAPTLAPTKLELAPEAAAQTVGVNQTLTATVTADPETGSTTRRLVANAEVTFIVDAAAADTGNSDFTRTATTDANGVASIAYTRNNPGTDTVTAYVTTSPTIRDSSTVQWGVGKAFDVTPTDAVTLANDQCRTYTYTAKNPVDGSLRKSATFHINFRENTGGTDSDGGATISANTTESPTATNAVESTTGTDGKATFTVCGSASTKTVTPVVFDENAGVNETLDSGDRFGDGGAITFQDRTPIFTVTPDDASTSAVTGQKVYTISAKDQFGQAWTKASGATIGLVELTDTSASTTSKAEVSWYDNDTSQSTDASNTCSGTIGSAPTAHGKPSGTIAADTDKIAISLGAAGTATFAICSVTTDDTAQPVVWFDKNANGLRESDEAQDTGGSVTYKAGAATSIKLSPSSATLATSTEDPVVESGTGSTASLGEQVFTFAILDQSGNEVKPSADQSITFVVTNTGSALLVIVAVDGATSGNACGTADPLPTDVPVGGSISCTATILSASKTSTTIELDSKNATSASITGSGAGGSATATMTWLSCSAEPDTTGASVTGTVVAVQKTFSVYCIDTTVGKFLITYQTHVADQYFVDGTFTAVSTFVSNLTVGDSIKWTKVNAGADEKHELTNK